MTPHRLLRPILAIVLATALLSFAAVGCDDDGGNNPSDAADADGTGDTGDTANPPDGDTSNPSDADTTNPPDGDTANPPDADTTNPPDADTTNPPDGVDMVDGTDTDMPPIDVERIVCSNTLPTPSSGLCEVTQGSATTLMLEGTVLSGDRIYENGRVVIDTSSANGTITCVGCDCAPAAATVVSCPDGVISPGLINPHDHITFNLSHPAQWDPERFEHRHDWRLGLGTHREVDTNPGSDNSAETVLYHEVRLLLGGATSVAGSGGAGGLVRNLDQVSNNGGLSGVDADYRTFPLGDSGGELRTTNCSYPNIDSEARAAGAPIYLPHISEGIDAEAQNEFRCLSDSTVGEDLILATTSVIHGIGLTGFDMQLMADRGASLVWSPRSNISLYGDTARVTAFRNLGVNIALGTDWTASGSMNVLRELACADYLNANHFDGVFTDQELWEMVTYNAAAALGAETQIGTIAEGFVADIAIFDGSQRSDYRAVIEAGVEDVVLVMRGGHPLVGVSELVGQLPGGTQGCSNLSLAPCGADRAICAQRDAGVSLATIQAAAAASPDPGELPPYALFFCGVPDKEPSCEPSRPSNDPTREPADHVYEMSSPTDPDGDGVETASDNCPTIFNPPRHLDGMVQADADGDGLGDACDPCLLSDTDQCVPANPDDRDNDGVLNLDDNCPNNANEDQADLDADDIGDVCDLCPDYPNPDGAGCLVTVYDIKQGGITGPVLVENVVVTGVAAGQGLFLQVPTEAPGYMGAPFSGVYVYLGNAFAGTWPQRGDCVALEGSVSEYFGQWQISDVSRLDVVTPCSFSLPSPVTLAPADIATSGMLADDYEGVLVNVQNVSVTALETQFVSFTVTGGLIVDNFFFTPAPYPIVGDAFSSVTGVLRWSFSESRLEPRDAGDLGPPSLVAFTEPLVFLPAGQTVDVDVRFGAPATMATPVTINYQGSAGVLTGATMVTIPQGATSAPLTLTGVAASTTPVTVTASYDGVDESFAVRVYDDAEQRVVASLDPATLQISLGQQGTLTVTLDLPAASGGTTVDLVSDDVSVGVPATVVVPAGQLTADVTVSGDALGTATLTASVGGGAGDTADVTVIDRVTRGVLFSEYVEGTSNNKAFEIVNDSGAALDLSTCSVKLYTNGSTSAGNTLALSGSLADQDVFVICHSQFVTQALCDVTGGVANYNGDDTLELVCGGVTVDVLGQIGNDPGTNWTAGGVATSEQTLRRKCAVTGGDANGSDAFDPSVQWDTFPQDTFGNLGTNHFTSCP